MTVIVLYYCLLCPFYCVMVIRYSCYSLLCENVYDILHCYWRIRYCVMMTIHWWWLSLLWLFSIIDNDIHWYSVTIIVYWLLCFVPILLWWWYCVRPHWPDWLVHLNRYIVWYSHYWLMMSILVFPMILVIRYLLMMAIWYSWWLMMTWCWYSLVFHYHCVLLLLWYSDIYCCWRYWPLMIHYCWRYWLLRYSLIVDIPDIVIFGIVLLYVVIRIVIVDILHWWCYLFVSFVVMTLFVSVFVLLIYYCMKLMVIIIVHWWWFSIRYYYWYWYYYSNDNDIIWLYIIVSMCIIGIIIIIDIVIVARYSWLLTIDDHYWRLIIEVCYSVTFNDRYSDDIVVTSAITMTVLCV